MAWKLLKDVPASATRKAARSMPKLLYFFSVTRTTFRGYILGVTASWIVQVGGKLCQFGKSMCQCKKVNDNIDKSEKIRQLKQKVFVATVRCTASLIFASIGAGIGASLFRPSTGQWIELANLESKACLGQLEERNKRVVRDLYKALASKDTQTLYGLVAQDLEWWFHGPPCHRHHLVPWLTGSSSPPSSSKEPIPDLIVGFGSVVVAEGYDEANLVWWVHAWSVNEDGVITQVREYVNTALTVTQLGVATSSLQTMQNASKCQSIWKSTLSDESVPGLILAI
ncbi:hypothetical protein PIB30_021881 [Stylosanthes scabra]|uniref:Uncharacterized protein n=1 Tax=Stylosanthes scabra TaxID=79078 RepID=A0ABU6R993_9FABA|nr:hypothetical protein [Stylosanthes scabra]